MPKRIAWVFWLTAVGVFIHVSQATRPLDGVLVRPISRLDEL
jgi:hypothetical protein